MNACDFEAVVYEGSVYCTDCLPEGVGVNDEGVTPIFASDEWDFAPTCDACSEEHDYMPILSAGDRFRLTITPCERDDDGVLLVAQGVGARAWAKDLRQSVLGTRWEADGSDFAYAIVGNRADLVKALAEEGYTRVDDAEWAPPEA